MTSKHETLHDNMYRQVSISANYRWRLQEAFPLNRFEFNTLIGVAKVRGSHNRRGKIRRKMPVIAATRPTVFRLPLDIQYMIVDYITEWRDSKNALSVFRWNLPDSYWKHRALGYQSTISELEAVICRDQVQCVDWQYLCIGLERLLATSASLLKRRRVISFLEEVRDDFQRALGYKSGIPTATTAS
ncbi:hypothetical protein FQN54_008695 [Arachnomyces sp. PD_36]|nr:hypothetical protein FQN54_008695 [Arachnomyces sp. PD_36]